MYDEENDSDDEEEENVKKMIMKKSRRRCWMSEQDTDITFFLIFVVNAYYSLNHNICCFVTFCFSN